MNVSELGRLSQKTVKTCFLEKFRHSEIKKQHTNERPRLNLCIIGAKINAIQGKKKRFRYLQMREVQKN